MKDEDEEEERGRGGKQESGSSQKRSHKVKMKQAEVTIRRSSPTKLFPLLLLLPLLLLALAKSKGYYCDTSGSSKGTLPAGYRARFGQQPLTTEAPYTPFDLLSASQRQPQFDSSQESLVIASRWQTEVFLPCKILGLDEDQTVSWIRRRDSLVLTIDKLKLIEDHRFQLASGEHDWSLVLSQPSNLDAGFYECQVSSMEPKLSRLIELRMVEANSFISNVSSLIVRPNESVNVTCTIEAPKQTDFVYWYKNKEPIQFDNLKQRYRPSSSSSSATSGERLSAAGRKRRSGSQTASYGDIKGRGNNMMTTSATQKMERESRRRLPFPEEISNDMEEEVSSSRTKQQQQQQTARKLQKEVKLMKSSSSLIIKRSSPNDTANYTCLPSNAKPSHISIFVIENGAQSQPEKRSLQATDGALSSMMALRMRPLLFELFAQKLAELLPNGQDWKKPQLDYQRDSDLAGRSADSSCGQLLLHLISNPMILTPTLLYLAHFLPRAT